MRYIAGFLVALASLLSGSVTHLTAQGLDPTGAVFQVVNLDTESNRQGLAGTGFFIQPDGTALTNSHVVYQTQHNPDRYKLLGIIGTMGSAEFYDTTLVCANKLPYDPTRTDPNHVGVQFSRDVAEIRLAPATTSFSTWVYFLKDGQKLTLARAHRGPLPEFPTLQIAGRPVLGQKIHVVGYGHISPLPEEWTATGQISRIGRASDGVATFDIDFTSRAQPGNSGSPVLNEQNQVIGIWTWYSYSQSNIGWAQSNTVLEHPCP